MKQMISFEKEIPFKTMIGEITSISLEHTLKFQDDSSILGDLIVSGTYKMTEASRLDEKFSYKIPVDILLTEALEEEGRSVEIDNFTYEIVDEEALFVQIDLLVEGLEKVELEPICKESEEIEVLPPKEEEEIEILSLEEEEEFQEEREEQEERSVSLEEDTLSTTLEEQKEEKKDPILNSLDPKRSTQQEVEIITTALENPHLDDMKTVINAQENIDKMSEKSQSVIPKEKASEMIQPKETTSNKEVMNSIFSVFKDTEETFSTYSIYILREEDTLDAVLHRYGITKEEASLYNNLEELRVGSKLILPTVISNE